MLDPSQQQQQQPHESPLPPPPPLTTSSQQQASGVVISFEQITKLFSVPIAEAAAKLGVCTSVLKRKCRENGLPKWPYRKVHAGKSIEDIKKEATIEKDTKQRLDSSSMSASVGTRVQDRTASQTQESSKFSSLVSNQQGNKVLQSEKTNMAPFSHTRNIPNYFDEFKYGFPASGLSSATHKWWGSGENEPGDKALDKAFDPGDKEVHIAVDSKDGRSENGDIVPQPVTRLTSLRKRALNEGDESLRLGVSKGYASPKLTKFKKSVLLQVFQSSLPNEWKDRFP